MFIYRSGTVVTKGTYWNPADGQRITMRHPGELPGDTGRGYLKMSPAGLLFIAPLFGLIFNMFLPLFGVGVFMILCLVPLIGTLASAAVAGVRVCCNVASGSAAFHWKPTKAAFSGAQKRKKSSVRNTAEAEKGTAAPFHPVRSDSFKDISVG